jgi:hypothetical protein
MLQVRRRYRKYCKNTGYVDRRLFESKMQAEKQALAKPSQCSHLQNRRIKLIEHRLYQPLDIDCCTMLRYRHAYEKEIQGRSVVEE